MAKQDEFTVVTQLTRVHTTLRSQYRVLTEVLNHPSAAAKLRQMMDICIQAQGELAHFIRPDVRLTAHNTVAVPVSIPTINSSVEPFKMDIDTVCDAYRDTFHNQATSGLWEVFIKAYNELNEAQQALIYNQLCNISESNPPWGFTEITE